MKLGFFTAALPGSTLEQAAKWGAESGFEAIEIACWPLEKATRRYAGVTHIDVDSAGQIQSRRISAKCWTDYGLTISSLGYYPNPLHPEADHRETVIVTSKEGDRRRRHCWKCQLWAPLSARIRTRPFRKIWKTSPRSGRRL